MVDSFLLLSGNDIPFFSAKLNIRQPTVKEIALIGEENFFAGVHLLNFSKELLNEEDRLNLVDTDDFDILMSIVHSEGAEQQRLNTAMILTLLFPDYTININPDGFYFINDTHFTIIDKTNFSEFRSIISQMFELKAADGEEYNPKNEAARRIEEKIKKGREKVAKIKNKGKKLDVFGRYVSILAIGLQMDMNVLLNHTVYQLYDEFKRFQLYQNFDINLKARMAGATDLEEVDNWMETIHS